jgi:hypothetical protein
MQLKREAIDLARSLQARANAVEEELARPRCRCAPGDGEARMIGIVRLDSGARDGFEMAADLADRAEANDLLALVEAERLEIRERRELRIEIVRFLRDVDERDAHWRWPRVPAKARTHEHRTSNDASNRRAKCTDWSSAIPRPVVMGPRLRGDDLNLAPLLEKAVQPWVRIQRRDRAAELR